ncbi:unnamed protein product [Adineta steineri]|uniref:Uncharacterized protein n=1 Tax=Adineta steineri TaxID=433720 RepID=A0A814Y6G3_9BILA|nr:unnamed protein product [Adineta steineri]
MDIAIQTVSKSEISLLDLLLIKRDTCINKTQIERVELNQKDNDVIDFDSAIILIGRFSNNNKQIQYYFNHSHSSHNQYNDLSRTCDYKYQTHSDKQQQINVDNQMIAQSYIAYSPLPKHFKPQLSYLVNNFHYESYTKNCYNSHSYRRSQHRSYVIDKRKNAYLHSNQQRGRYW